jgi:hypothetical protein
MQRPMRADAWKALAAALWRAFGRALQTKRRIGMLPGDRRGLDCLVVLMPMPGLSQVSGQRELAVSPLDITNESPIRPASRWPIRIGWTLSTIVILFLVMDAGMKIAGLPVVTESASAIGWTADPGFWRVMGFLLLAITAVYAWKRTATLGAILLTGYLGGAVATHLRLNDPLYTHTLFGVYLGIALWGGLWLRDTGVRRLLRIANRHRWARF